MIPLDGNISSVSEIVGAFGGCEDVEEFADLAPGRLDVARLGVSQKMLQLGKDLLDRIEVWAIGRQKDQVSAHGPDGVAGCFALVAAEIVEDDDVALGEGRSENLLGIEGKELAVDGAVEDPRRADPIVAQRGDEGQGLPVAMRRCGLETLASWSPPAQGRHVGFDPGLIDEDQPRSVNLALTRFPALPLAGDVGSILLGGQNCFF